MNRHLVTLSVLALVSGCGRDFEPPPGGPEPVALNGVQPDSGFLGDRIELLGSHFAPEAGQNTVFFGSQSAEVLELSERPQDAESTQALVVAVPRLNPGERVSLKVVTPGSQGVLDDAFSFEGDGHPLRAEVTGERMPRALPVAAFSLPGHDSPVHGVLNRDSREVALLFEENGLQVHAGLCDQPLAAAAALVSVAGGLGVQIWTSTLEVIGADGLAAATGLLRLEIRLAADLTLEFLPPEAFALPEVLGETPWPLMVWAVCPTQVCLTHHLLVSDALAPRLYRIQPASMTGNTPAPEVLPLTRASQDCGDDLGQGVIDLKQDPQNLDLYALAFGGREVWRVPAGSSRPELAFTLGDVATVGNADPCQTRASALAVDRSRAVLDPERVYLALTAPVPAVIAVENSALGWRETARVGLDGFPYAMVVGRLPAADGLGLEQRLFVATTLGLRVYLLGGATPVPVLAEATAVSVGNSGALAVDEVARLGGARVEPDRVLLADPTGDWLRVYVAGREGEVSTRLPVSSPVPELARGDASGVLFLGDPLSNAIRVIDRDSGAQLAQFAARGSLGFATTGLRTVPLPGADLLLAPVALAGTGHLAPYRGLVARIVGPAAPPPECHASMADTPTVLLDIDEYDRMTFLRRPAPLLYFIRDPEPDAGPLETGRLWAVPVNTGATTVEAALPSAVPVLDVPLPAGLLKTSLDPAGEILGLLVSGALGTQLVVAELGSSETRFASVDPVLADMVDSLAVVRPHDPDGPAALALLSVPVSGEVLALAFGADGTVTAGAVSTGGAPQALAVSPDRRRAYVAHPGVGQVSAIDLDCSPLPDCLRVEANLRVADLPYALQFSPDGGEVLVLHLYNGRITVIE